MMRPGRGEDMKTSGILIILAGIACTTGIIVGVGRTTGNWAAAAGGAMGLFFCFIGMGSYVYYTGRKLVHASESTPFQTFDDSSFLAH